VVVPSQRSVVYCTSHVHFLVHQVRYEVYNGIAAITVEEEGTMRPLNVVLMVVIALGLAILLGWSQVYAEKRRALKICVWTGAILFLIFVRVFLPDSGIGPASWADVYDWIMPDGYSDFCSRELVRRRDKRLLFFAADFRNSESP
jgi:hypothetical protein